MEFRILGSLQVLADEREIALGGAQQREVLAILLLHRGEVVSVDRIVDELWGERPPDRATKTVQVYVPRLRKELGDGVLSVADQGDRLGQGQERPRRRQNARASAAHGAVARGLYRAA